MRFPSPVPCRHYVCLSPLLFLAAILSGGCATAFEYPKTGHAWGQIVDETPGKPVLVWNSASACILARLGPCRPMAGQNGQVSVLSHWDRPSRSIYLWTSREACETPKWMGYTGTGNLSKRECRPMSLEPGVDFWVFTQEEWRTNWSGGAHWIGSDRREICDEWRLYIGNSRQPTSDCVRVRVK